MLILLTVRNGQNIPGGHANLRLFFKREKAFNKPVDKGCLNL
jgi:hypothetical protein